MINCTRRWAIFRLWGLMVERNESLPGRHTYLIDLKNAAADHAA